MAVPGGQLAGHISAGATSERAPLRIPYRGGAITLLLLLLLLTPPAELLEQAGAYTDTRGDIRSPTATPIRMEDGLTSDPASAIPRVLGNWTGVDDDSWPDLLQDSLAYDTLLVRHYARPGFYEPVQLMVLSARHAAAFHNPTVCFRVQGSSVLLLEDTHIEFADHEHAVGRMVVDDGQRPRVVYNLYLVEEKFASPTRTTWLRLSFSGAGLDTEPQLEPFLVDLLEQIAPHAFTGRAGARTTMEALADLGWAWAAGAGVAAVLPVAAEALVQRRPRSSKEV